MRALQMDIPGSIVHDRGLTLSCFTAFQQAMKKPVKMGS
jgi:hypothetical protein